MKKKIMKNWTLIAALAVALAVIVSGGMQGCTTMQSNQTTTAPAPSFAETQYKALSASQELYNLSWGGFVQLYKTKAINKAGKIIVDQERYDRGLKLATTYHDAWMAWIDAVMDYEKAKGAEGTVAVEKAMQIAKKAATDLMTMLQPYLQEGGK